MLIKPASGLMVRHPITMTPLPAGEATEVSETDFHWNRLLRDGDVVLATAPAAAKSTPATAAKSAEDRSV